MFVLDYPVLITLAGSSIVGISSGILSCFAVLRKQSLLGDVISHAALPGLCIAFMLTLSKNPLLLLLGAFTTGLIGTLLINILTKKTFLKQDTALGIILSVFFGIGILLLTVIQNIPTARQSGLDSFLFGNAASMLSTDVIIQTVCLCAICILTYVCFKELKGISFDLNFMKTLGYNVNKIELLLTLLLVLTIIMGLQTVGVILMSALIIAPGVAARQWTHQLHIMILVSCMLSAFASIGGVLISSTLLHMPTGPSIVMMISVIVFLSLLFAPKRGLYQIKKILNRSKTQQKNILTLLYYLAQSHEDQTHPHDIHALAALGGKPTLNRLMELKRKGLVKNESKHKWGLTHTGLKQAKRIIKKESP